MIAQAGLQQAGLQGFEFFDYGKIGLPMLIVGTIFYATIGKRFLPATPSRTPDASYQGNDDYSHIPSWKKWIAGLVLVGTVAAMIFEKELGVKLYVSAWIGALILVATNVITETAAIVVGSSLAYATPIGMPANTMVYNIAGYSFMDYVKAGIPLIVVSMIVSLTLLPILFPFHP